MIKQSVKRRWRVLVTSGVLAAMLAGTSGLAHAAVINDLLAVVAGQLAPLQLSVEENGGLGVYSNGDTNVVMIPAEKAADIDAFQAALDAKRDGLLNTIRVSQFTTAALTTLSDKLGSRAATGIGQEYSILESYDPESDTYEIQTDAPAELTAPLLAGHPGQLSVKWGTAVEEARFNDRDAYSGAGSIHSGNATCTAGVSIRNQAGADLMTTAGHCFGVGAQVYSADGGGYLGNVNTRSGAYSVETELIYSSNVDYRARIWTGGTGTSTSSLPVGGFRTAGTGLGGLFMSGQTTLNKPRGSIKNGSINFCPAGQTCTITSNQGFSYAGGTPSEGGDSGAPIFTVAGGRASIVGLHSGSMVDAAGERVSVGVKMAAVLNYYDCTLNIG